MSMQQQLTNLDLRVKSEAIIRFEFIVLPITAMGFRANRNRPAMPMYLLRQPADHNLNRYSTPKNSTRKISIQ